MAVLTTFAQGSKLDTFILPQAIYSKPFKQMCDKGVFTQECVALVRNVFLSCSVHQEKIKESKVTSQIGNQKFNMHLSVPAQKEIPMRCTLPMTLKQYLRTQVMRLYVR